MTVFPRLAAVLITAQSSDPTGLALEDLVTTVYLNHVGPGALRHTIGKFLYWRFALFRLCHDTEQIARGEPLR